MVDLEGIGWEPVVVWFLANVAAPPLGGGPQWNPAPLAFGALESKPVADLWCRVVVDDLVGVPFWMALHGLHGFVGLFWQLGHGGVVVGHGLTGAHGAGGLARTLGNELGQLQWLRMRRRFFLATNCKIQGSSLRI